MTDKKEALSLAMLAVSETRNFWSDNLPPLKDVAKEDTADITPWIRRGEFSAIGLSVALGVAASLLCEQPWPLVGAVLMSAYMFYQYESALKYGVQPATDLP